MLQNKLIISILCNLKFYKFSNNTKIDKNFVFLQFTLVQLFSSIVINILKKQLQEIKNNIEFFIMV